MELILYEDSYVLTILLVVDIVVITVCFVSIAVLLNTRFPTTRYNHMKWLVILIAIFVAVSILVELILSDCKCYNSGYQRLVLHVLWCVSIPYLVMILLKFLTNKEDIGISENSDQQTDVELLSSKRKKDILPVETTWYLEKWLEEKCYLKNGLTLNEVSTMIGASNRKLSEYVHARYNLTFNSWINMLRIEEVKRILDDKTKTTKNLSEIADETGFTDLARMSNLFKRFYSVSPSEYRRSVLGR